MYNLCMEAKVEIINQPVSDFVRRIEAKKLPIPVVTAEAFEAFHTDKSPEGFLDRTVDSCTFLDEERFQKSLEGMRLKVNELFPDGNYDLLLGKIEGSSDWIYRQLVGKGMVEARQILVEDKIPADEFRNPLFPKDKQYVPLEEATSRLPIVVVDDWSITGKWMDKMLHKVPKGRRKYVFLTMASKNAKDRLRSQHPSTKFQIDNLDIKLLDDVFNNDDLKYIKAVGGDFGFWSAAYEGSNTWAYYGTPDNVPSAFLIGRKPGVKGLIPSKIPVYRDFSAIKT